MATPTVTAHLIARSGLDENLRGYSLQESYLVENLSGDPASLQYQALFAPGIPQKFQAHAYIPGVAVSHRVTRELANSKTQMYVDVTWSSPERGSGGVWFQVTISSSSGQKVISRYPDSGKPINVYYVDPTDNQVKPDYASFSVLSPNITIEIERYERQCPLEKAARFARKLNASTIWGLPEQTVLCRAIRGTGVSSLSSWQVSYVFEFAPYSGPDLSIIRPVSQKADIGAILPVARVPRSGWTEVAYFFDPNSGRVPAGINPENGDGNGYLPFVPYTAENFDDLALPDIRQTLQNMPILFN